MHDNTKELRGKSMNLLRNKGVPGEDQPRLFQYFPWRDLICSMIRSAAGETGLPEEGTA